MTAGNNTANGLKQVGLSLLAASMLAACTVGPDFIRPAVTSPPAATNTSIVANLAVDRQVAFNWWRAFGDPVLDALENEALAGNLDIQEAGTRVQRSRAALRIAGANSGPRASAAASYMRERGSPKGILGLTGARAPASDSAGGADPFGTTTLPGENGSPSYDLFQVGIDASWEIDLWGKNRRNREAARADAQASFFDQQALRVSLSAEVARVYATLRGAEAKLDILKRNRDTVLRSLEIARQRQQLGAANRLDAATAAAQLSTIESAIPAAERDAAAARNALALLCGKEPHALDVLLHSGDTELIAVPAELAGGLSSELARARPDILSAEAALHAATARIGVAKADFYPGVSLTGSFGTQALGLSDVVGWSARQFIVGPALHLPLFENGRLKGQLELVKADQKAAAIRYRATVLRAWHEVDDALETVRMERARYAGTQSGVEQSRIAVHVSQRRYQSGATGYLDVLIAERAELEREVALADARTAHAVAVTNLYKAFGGGWVPSGGTTDAGR
jgi:NodT family efflux transporter outer membrane factor (OMF) lipoprotein